MAHISPTEGDSKEAEEGAMVWYDEASDFFLLDCCAEGMTQNEGGREGGHLEKRRRRALGTRNN